MLINDFVAVSMASHSARLTCFDFMRLTRVSDGYLDEIQLVKLYMPMEFCALSHLPFSELRSNSFIKQFHSHQCCTNEFLTTNI